jgi:hypothetical protein
MRQCQRLTIWSGCPAYTKEKTGRGDPRLTIFVRGTHGCRPKSRGARVDLRPIDTCPRLEACCTLTVTRTSRWALPSPATLSPISPLHPPIHRFPASLPGVALTLRRPHRQRMSSVANALLCNIGEVNQCNLLSFFSALHHLCGTHSCGKRARKGHLHGHEHTCC